MIRSSIEKDTEIWHEVYGFGLFKGWFQGSLDIAIVDWKGSKERTLCHKRGLTEIEKEVIV